MHVYTYYAVMLKIIVSDFSHILVTVFLSFHCSRTSNIHCPVIDLTYLKKKSTNNGQQARQQNN